jgi:hypothetical protein
VAARILSIFIRAARSKPENALTFSPATNSFVRLSRQLRIMAKDYLFNTLYVKRIKMPESEMAKQSASSVRSTPLFPRLCPQKQVL